MRGCLCGKLHGGPSRGCCSHFSSHRSDSQILAENRDFLPTPPAFDPPSWRSRQNIAITFGTEKTRTVWLPDGENILKICFFFISTKSTNVTDGQTDGRGDRHRKTA